MNNNEWQVIETMPKDGTVVLGYYLPTNFVVAIWVFPSEKNKIYWGIDDEYFCLDSSKFSHWMPLPKPPTQ
jgi:hypothetical protein